MLSYRRGAAGRLDHVYNTASTGAFRRDEKDHHTILLPTKITTPTLNVKASLMRQHIFQERASDRYELEHSLIEGSPAQSNL